MAKFGRDAAAACAPRLEKWKTCVQKEAALIEVPASVVAAIITRETGGFSTYCLPPPGGQLGDNGHGCGPMQVDDRSWPTWCAQWKAGTLEPEDGIHMGCQVLAAKMKAVRSLIPVPQPTLLRAAVAAYNCGEGNVRRAWLAGHDLDESTTNKNYSSDVMERAAFFAENGY